MEGRGGEEVCTRGEETEAGSEDGACRGGNKCVGYLLMFICRVLRACAVITVI